MIAKTLVVRVSAPSDLCLERVAKRDQTNQIPMDVESIRKVYALSEAAELRTDLTLSNVEITEAEIIALFKRALTVRLNGQPQETTPPQHDAIHK